MSSNLMDTEPGGEQTQYESIKQHTILHKKEHGQLGDPADTSTPASKTQSSGSGDVTAQNVSNAESIRDSDVGGSTGTGFEGAADHEDREDGGERSTDAGKSRTVQGYPPGSGVGA
ncbi:hypothetical protein M501DRAFT_1003122 [Patellaria atrata CBS 101060]|uniref:Uncharacterized protein n=1 Tax=Patellaria atrata CBS 101060 TaxID=1346257 RepID=A0A9P4SC52_9PEZI|nr:hypothetical protein M501DRAFT_1003122 [Patellaria atrata CBS 101060]